VITNSSDAFATIDRMCGVTRPMHDSRNVKRVGIILYDGFSLLSAGTLVEALHAASEMNIERSNVSLSYRVSLISARGGKVSCSSSMSVWTDEIMTNQIDHFDALFVPGGSGAARACADDELINLMRSIRAKDVTVTAIGNGEMILLASGIEWCEWPSVQREIRLVPSPAAAQEHERDEALVTSLALLRADLGAAFAARVADRLSTDDDLSLASGVEDMSADTLAEKARASARWLVQNCSRQVSVVEAARSCSMSERNFLRAFKREMGVTPSKYLLQARLDLTCKMLLSSDLPVDKIARRTGLSNGERLSKLFRKAFAMSPTEFRARNRFKA
jgi:transcriptional regulator GlxA family with amidase domain